MNEKNQQAAEDEIVHHRAGGDADEVGAVIEWDQFYARRKTPIAVDLFNFGPHARYDIVGVQRAVHDDNRSNDIILVIATGLAEPRHVANRDLGNVFHEYWHAVGLTERDILDVLDLVTLRQIRGPAASPSGRRREC